MSGQWIGNFTGTNKGRALVELDDRGDHLEGRAYAFSDDPQLPSLVAWVRTPNKNDKFDLDLIVQPIINGRMEDWDQIKGNFPNVTLSPHLKTSWELSGDDLKLAWTTPIGTNGNAQLLRLPASDPSSRTPIADVKSWPQFREFVASLEPRRFVFRGQQSSNWKLVTAFHRHGRYDLMRFVQDDIPQLHGHLTGLTAHRFYIENDVENAAFHSLAQHHGYPTPLLDWTHSPYIAAFFAFRGIRKADQSAERFVRVFVFDLQEWQNDHTRVQMLTLTPPHLTFLKALALNNPRMIPQQALSSITNLNDIEHFINWEERQRSKPYLRVIDLPTTERSQVMQELAMMGITAGSLFPGLDGACEQMKEQHFDL